MGRGAPSMRRVVTAPDAFGARVMAARLGCEGIVWELRGAVDGPYPIGPVELHVEACAYELACELLLADAVADALGENSELA
jgi:hypothetical protein